MALRRLTSAGGRPVRFAAERFPLCHRIVEHLDLGSALSGGPWSAFRGLAGLRPPEHVLQCLVASPAEIIADALDHLPDALPRAPDAGVKPDACGAVAVHLIGPHGECLGLKLLLAHLAGGVGPARVGRHI